MSMPRSNGMFSTFRNDSGMLNPECRDLAGTDIAVDAGAMSEFFGGSIGPIYPEALGTIISGPHAEISDAGADLLMVIPPFLVGF
jgi:hypothetical protein